jgi:hypothetical protein
MKLRLVSGVRYLHQNNGTARFSSWCCVNLIGRREEMPGYFLQDNATVHS